MNINFTIIGQSISMLVFVWLCMKYIWPPIMNALDERRQRIADGLADAEQGTKDLELAKGRAAEIIREAKQQASEITDAANQRAGRIVDEGRDDGQKARERQLAAANAEIEQEINRAREHLRGQVADIAVAGAEKILQREIDPKAHKKLLDELVAQI
ncbi:MAG: F0F1 ATP synthase subunit B [Gammaproteobacteria bacterium]|nr:MAG: F0F1 ATP synthase subunit B [Gammaproteobacteria bacterium]